MTSQIHSEMSSEIFLNRIVHYTLFEKIVAYKEFLAGKQLQAVRPLKTLKMQ